MPVAVSVTVDQAAVAGFIRGQVADRVQRAAGRVRDHAKAEITAASRVDTGQMRDAVTAETAEVDGGQVRARVVAHAEHSAYQHEGTPQTIYPRRARVLRFAPRGGAFVFAPTVRGIHPSNPTKPLPFLTLGLARLNASDFT